MCRLLAQSGHVEVSAICPLSGAKRTSAGDCRTIAIYECPNIPANIRIGQQSLGHPTRPAGRASPLAIVEQQLVALLAIFEVGAGVIIAHPKTKKDPSAPSPARAPDATCPN
jgi:hypothetical protein